MKLFVKTFHELSNNELYDILYLRNNVFIVEQNCAYNDIDNMDKKSYHMLCEENGNLIGYLRIIPEDVSNGIYGIGRVISIRRRQGVATKMLKEAIYYIRTRLNAEKIILEAQVYAKGLYEKCGFKTTSDVFLLDGIPHVRMEINL